MQLSTTRDEKGERWSIDWRVTNSGIRPLQVLSVGLPHGQFKSDESRFQPFLNLKPGETGDFKVLVHCDEPQGMVTENAFAIFQVDWLGEPWRVFVRLRVNVGEDGRPETNVESVTTQKVGFSGIDS